MTGTATPLVVWESLELGDYGIAQACLYTSPKNADLVFSLRGTAPIPQAERNPKQETYGFDIDPASQRIRVALQWALELNSSAETRFKQGKQVTINIPHMTLVGNVYSTKANSTEDYWSLRFPVGALIRPLLLIPPSLNGLLPFQREGVEWLLHHSSAILADDMGLGKTIQAITAARILIHSGAARQCLILCPKSLIQNWASEIAKWGPELCCLAVTPKSSSRKEVWATVFSRCHIVLTNYEQIRNASDFPVKTEFDLIITDEAHRTRNLSAKTTQALRLILRKRFWALTGTPIERDANDLATLLSTVDPHRFAPSDGQLEPNLLRSRAKPYVFRRTKEAVLDQLPDVLESTEFLDLLPKQKRSYRNAIKAASKSDKGEPALLALLSHLRQICDYDEDSQQSVKIDRIHEILSDIANIGEKVVVFSYFIRPLQILNKRLSQTLGQDSSLLLEGSLPTQERELVLKRFKSNQSVHALLASSRLAGEGLTLTEANHVIFLNEWWNPSANAQARDRIVRIGQQRAVRVYRFICKGTIEELLQSIQQRKTRVFSELIGALELPQGLATQERSVLEEIARLTLRNQNEE